MTKFAFKADDYMEGGEHHDWVDAAFHGDSDVVKHVGMAHKLKRHLESRGYEAHIETGQGPNTEHRVWVQHPEHKDLFSYASREQFGTADEQHKFTPIWDRK